MDVFEFEPIPATMVIAVVGVLLQVGMEALQSKEPFDGRKLLSIVNKVITEHKCKKRLN